MPIQRAGVTATPAQLAELFHDLSRSNQPLTPWTQCPARFPYTGPIIDYSATAEGAPQTPVWPTPPADAVALQLFSNSIATNDGFALTLRAGRLDSTGVLATNTAANMGTANNSVTSARQPARHVIGGQSMILPLSAVGAAVPATFRTAALTSNGQRIQGYFLSEASGFPYLMTATMELLLVGTAVLNAFQFPTLTATIFPVGYKAVDFQVVGDGARFVVNGESGLPTATQGIPLPAGSYTWDEARHGISFSTLKFWLPDTVCIVGHVWN